ncbi:hypothetical protein [Embleya hyalina]|nr:hypothetical protein [Embleya hyalina]
MHAFVQKRAAYGPATLPATLADGGCRWRLPTATTAHNHRRPSP